MPAGWRIRSTAFLAAALVAGGCGSDAVPAGPTSTPGASFQQHASPNFTFHYTPLDAGTVADTAARVEAEHARILGDLQAPAMSRVSVYLYADQPSMQAAVAGVVGTLPAFARGLITGADRIHVLSPSLSNLWSYGDAVQAIVHEFAHCVSWQLNPTIANNPRWLWETVAIYESRQFVDPRSVPSLTSGRPPSLAQLNANDNTDVYAVGFVIGEFVVSRWGREGLAALVRANGNTTSVTGLNEAEFVAAWYAFVRSRYF